jgi:hypothetical protein
MAGHSEPDHFPTPECGDGRIAGCRKKSTRQVKRANVKTSLHAVRRRFYDCGAKGIRTPVDSSGNMR